MRIAREEEFHTQFIRDLEEEGIHLIDLKTGTFDAITDTKNPIIVEFKWLMEFPKEWSHTYSSNGIALIAQSEGLKKVEYNYPAVVVFTPNEEEFNLLSPKYIEKAMRNEGRAKFDKKIISKKSPDVPFPTALSYKELLSEFLDLMG